MKILYDHQIFTWQRIGGISRYFVELMNNLPPEFASKQSALFTDNVYLSESSKFNNGISLFPGKSFRGKRRAYTLVNKSNTFRLLSTSGVDIFHPTYYDPYFLQRNKKPYVITVYDMIHEKFADMFDANDPTREYKKKTVLNADKVIAISNQTKQDLIELYGMDEEKIQVVYLGHSVDINAVSEVKGLPSNYVLYVGARGGYKNFGTFLKAFAMLAHDNPDLSLVCTGGSFTAEEQAQITSLHLSERVFRFFVSDSQLTYLYRKARCFIFPSLYEGFGIPILEAFAAGCPIALSNTSCFPEIAREGGIYFDPYKVDSMVHALSVLLNDDVCRDEQIARGYEVLKQYSWKKMAEETADIYRSLL